MSILKRYADPFIITILATLTIGILVPIPDSVLIFTSKAAKVMIYVLFFLYGGRLATSAVVAGLKNWRLQLAVFLFTYLGFPLLGIAFHPLNLWLLGSVFSVGCLYLTLLPSTVQASVTFTSLARGNVAGAVCSATISNVLGVFITPLLVLLIMGRASGIDLSRVTNVFLQILLPFVVGQIAGYWIGTWLRDHAKLTKKVDNLTILLIVFSSVAGATKAGLWKHVAAWQVLLLLVTSALLLSIVLLATWQTGKLLTLKYPDRIVLLMCGSKKSLATGLPMATIIFPATTIAAVTVPLIVFHQLQLIVCAIISRHLGAKVDAGTIQTN